MRSFLSKIRLDAEVATERAVDNYDVAWGAEQPSLGRFWEGLGSTRSLSTLAALIKVDLQHRFALGERPRAAEYFERFPELTESSDRVVSLVYEEFCLLQESGANPDSEDFCDAYEPWRESLLSQLVYHRQLSQAVGAEVPPVKFPEPGDQFEKYQIRSLLGTGGVARVYLATEDDLGGRKVALKVSASFGQEPSILANLDHRNIVPILGVARSDSGLLGFSMPYRSGMTLEELIKRIGRGTPPRSALALWKALSPPKAQEDLNIDDQRPGWGGFPIEGTFSEGVAWIGLALSNALSYLHGEQVFHRDIKPANVLLAFREGPQLLDFNLAQNPRAPGQVQAALKGGTIPYMAPEHLHAFIDPSGWEAVDSAADIYSLGLVLRELVTGRPQELPNINLSLPRGIQSLFDRRKEPILSIREINPSVPPALDSIISKCLAFDPARRYANASDLAEDLKRFLDRKPLEHAPNTSAVERSANFVHRNRFLVVGSILLFLALSIANVWLTPTPVQKLSQFQSAVRELDSNRPEEWERAKLAFVLLRRRYPGSAWPALYLGLAQEKMVGLDAEASKNLIDTTKCPDAEEAISERLKSEPKSATLRTVQGMVLMQKKEDDRARVAFNLAIEADPLRIQAILGLIDLDRSPQKFENAIRSITKAIEFGEREKTAAGRLYGLRMQLLPHLARQADFYIDSGPSCRERARAARHLDRIRATLEASKEDLNRMMATSGGEFSEYTGLFYRGCLASCRAVLAADRGDISEAGRLIECARDHLDKAFDSVPTGIKNADQVRLQVEEQRKKVERRYRDHVSPHE